MPVAEPVGDVRGVSVVIPTLNAASDIAVLLDRLVQQTVVPSEILVIDSASDDATLEICSAYPAVRTTSILRQDFDHAGTRHDAFGETSGEFVLFLTQDALPLHDDYIERLIAPFADPSVAMASGRQVARADASNAERRVREYNYPAEGFVRTAADIPALGIRTFFASDVCSAYRRSAYNSIGGFRRPTPTNEDMIVAADLIHAGFAVAYCGDAEVVHSHDLSFAQQFRRNFDVGASLQMHSDALGGVSETGEGLKLVKHVVRGLASERAYGDLARFSLDVLARLAGNRAGRMYMMLPQPWVIALSSNRSYWRRHGAPSGEAAITRA